MEALDGIAEGLRVAATPLNLMYVMIGVLCGMVVGILPGLGPVATIALLLPLTYYIPADSAIILLAGIFYGAMYGGTITSVLLRLPGEAASVVTTFDGYPMAQQGRAGPALGIAAIGSFIGGTASVLGLALLAPVIARYALDFGPPEYSVLALLGLALIVSIASRSPAKTAVSACVGLLLAVVGQDLFTAEPRYTVGMIDLYGGIELVPIAMGLFGIAEVLDNVGKRHGQSFAGKMGSVLPTVADFIQSRAAILRGSLLGFALGILPGAGATIASLASYGMEKRTAKDPDRFGKGAIEGVAGPESANNAAATGSFAPLLTLGIPGSASTAIIYGALLLHNVQPGPLLIRDHPNIFWGVIASMLIGNIVLLVLNMPLIGIFVQVLKVRLGILSALIAVVTVIGTYGLNNSFFDVWLMLAFGAIGYLMKRVGLEPGPLVLAFVLGPILERSFRQSMLMSDSGLGIYLDRPLALGLLIATVAVAAAPFIMPKRQRAALRTVAVGEE